MPEQRQNIARGWMSKKARTSFLVVLTIGLTFLCTTIGSLRLLVNQCDEPICGLAVFRGRYLLGVSGNVHGNEPTFLVYTVQTKPPSLEDRILDGEQLFITVPNSGVNHPSLSNGL